MTLSEFLRSLCLAVPRLLCLRVKTQDEPETAGLHTLLMAEWDTQGELSEELGRRVQWYAKKLEELSITFSPYI